MSGKENPLYNNHMVTGCQYEWMCIFSDVSVNGPTLETAIDLFKLILKVMWKKRDGNGQDILQNEEINTWCNTEL